VKVALVVPKVFGDCEVSAPLGLSYIASYLKKCVPSVAVKIFDATVDEQAYMDLFLFHPDIVGCTSTTRQIYEAYRLLDEIKKCMPETLTVIGGSHASALPSEAGVHADCVVIGEGEIVFSEIVKNYLRGLEVDKVIMGLPVEDLDDIPIPDFEAFGVDIGKYLLNKIEYSGITGQPILRLVTSRGCIERCPFCWNSTRSASVRYQSVDYVLKMIGVLFGKHHMSAVWFHDDEFVSNKKRLYEFMMKFKASRFYGVLEWTCQSRVTSMDYETAKRMKASGCKSVAFGIESASRTLGFLKCGKVTVSDVEKALLDCKRAGLRAFGAFIFGSVGERISDMEETWGWIQTHRTKGLTNYSFGVLAPYPGTKLYEYAINLGVFSQDTIDYGKIDVVANLDDHYLVDLAVSRSEFQAFLHKACDLRWAESQLRYKNVRGVFTPTFLRVVLRHPRSMFNAVRTMVPNSVTARKML
jgi:radical SAM superfamily enzyme YgiQ (UPF0313 family)